MASILWFKRDLRVMDNAALWHAAQAGPVLPVYVFEPDYWALPDTSGRQFRFVQESVADLRVQLEQMGLGLTVQVGNVIDIFDRLRASHGITRIFSHEETGGGWTFQRDLDVAAWAKAHAVNWTELPQSGVRRRSPGRDSWAQARNQFLRNGVVGVPESARGLVAASDAIPDLADADHCPRRQKGGRLAGLRNLDSFLTTRGQTYRRDMSSPLSGEAACSRLSPYLAFGCLSGREAAQAAANQQRAVKGTRDGWGGSLKAFQSRLAWRDHFVQKLEDEPQIETRCLHSAYEGLRADDPTLRAAWEKGETGLPFVDACMRYLMATGWLNFRMRSMLLAVASYHLWLDWRATGAHLARQFTDFEPGIHWPQVQMQSGTTGMNTVRIYNPIKQGWDQDPRGVFTRRWVPELKDVPNAMLHEPWKWEGMSRIAYPAPIIDVAAAARSAREQVYAVRKGTPFRVEAAKVIDKHASRKDRQGHFVNDRSPRKRSDDPRQGAFDF